MESSEGGAGGRLSEEVGRKRAQVKSGVMGQAWPPSSLFWKQCLLLPPCPPSALHTCSVPLQGDVRRPAMTCVMSPELWLTIQHGWVGQEAVVGLMALQLQLLASRLVAA